jgi:Nucleotidyl transferase AbiEii toxin, Type IV TA system
VTETTRPATWEDICWVARLLDEHHVKYALIGGYALAAHGIVRFSEDVDVLVAPDVENTRRWVAALSELPDGAAKELAGEEATLWEGDGPLAIRINDEFTVDVMASACGHDWAELAPTIESKLIDAQVIRVLSLEGLLLTKEGMRDKDRADARVLRQVLAEGKE